MRNPSGIQYYDSDAIRRRDRKDQNKLQSGLAENVVNSSHDKFIQPSDISINKMDINTEEEDSKMPSRQMKKKKSRHPCPKANKNGKKNKMP
jgi:hypothetical protein